MQCVLSGDLSNKQCDLPDCSIDLYIGPSPSALCNEVAFRIFPIAHQYDMHVVLKYSETALESASKAALLDLWPSTPIASSQVPKHPGLVQWLALADSKQCAPLVESCVSQLLPSDSNDTIRRALASPHLRKLVDGLHSETKTGIMCRMAGLLLGCQQVGFMLWGQRASSRMGPGGIGTEAHLSSLYRAQGKVPEIDHILPGVYYQVGA